MPNLSSEDFTENPNPNQLYADSTWFLNIIITCSVSCQGFGQQEWQEKEEKPTAEEESLSSILSPKNDFFGVFNFVPFTA